MKIVLEIEFPTMNEIINIAKKHWTKYANMKKQYTDFVVWNTKKYAKIHEQVDITFIWWCKNKRKDKDNIMAGQKFILDGLQKTILDNDNWKCVRNITHKFEVDKYNPRVEVLLKEFKEEGSNESDN